MVNFQVNSILLFYHTSRREKLSSHLPGCYCYMSGTSRSNIQMHYGIRRFPEMQ